MDLEWRDSSFGDGPFCSFGSYRRVDGVLSRKHLGLSTVKLNKIPAMNL